MNIQFKKGVLEICVLSLINSRDYYGYELVQAISENIDIAEGSVYPLLRRLSKEGFFETYLKESNDGPPRKYYKITAQGAERTVLLKKEWSEFTEQVGLILKKAGRVHAPCSPANRTAGASAEERVREQPKEEAND